MEIEKTTLDGRLVRLVPLAREHLPELANVIRDGDLASIPVTFVPRPEELEQFYAEAEAAYDRSAELPFATFDKKSGALVGSTRFMDISARFKRVEIGFTFIAASQQRTHVNTEAKYLMLRHAFEHWQVNRVALLTDVRNSKSRAAIARIGAQQEGILRSHMVMRDGYVRDTVVFSIVRSEWPRVKAALEARMG